MSDKVSFGRRLALIVVADIAREQPHKLYGSIARTSNPQDGFDDITYLRFANAINRASWWLERTFGRSTTFETIAYSGPFDLRYPIFIIAAVKVGYKVCWPSDTYKSINAFRLTKDLEAFLLSPQNADEATISLMRSTNCVKYVTAEQSLDKIKTYTKTLPDMQIVVTPTLEDWLQKGDTEQYPYTKEHDEAKIEPFVVLLTSESTGLSFITFSIISGFWSFFASCRTI